MTYQPKVYREQGGTKIVILSEDSGVIDISGSDTVLMTKAGVPTDGTSGTGAGVAGTGSLCIDRTNAKLYINTNTKASPLWTVVGLQTS